MAIRDTRDGEIYGSVFSDTYIVPASCNILRTTPFPARDWTGRSQTVGRKEIDPPPLVQSAAMHLGRLFWCYDNPSVESAVREEGNAGEVWEQESIHERVDPVLRHPSFLFIFRNRDEGTANYHTANVEEDGLEIGVWEHVPDQGSKSWRWGPGWMAGICRGLRRTG